VRGLAVPKRPANDYSLFRIRRMFVQMHRRVHARLATIMRPRAFALPVPYPANVVERAAAAEIHRQWVEAGSPPCDHPKLIQEYHNGLPTGRQVCRRCGLADPTAEYRPDPGGGT